MKVFGSLQINVNAQKDAVTVVDWRGESDAMDPGALLTPYLQELTRSLKGKVVELRFSDLSYMNSSTVTPLMEFLRALSGAAKRVTVVYRADLQWQVTSFRAMRVVARKWSNVKVLGV